MDLAGAPAQPSAPHDLVELTGQGVPHAIALTVELSAQVEGELHLARYDVHAAGEGLEAADRADDVVLGAAEPLDGEGTFARPEERVAAHVVGGSAGVPGLPFDREQKAARTGDRGDDGERLASTVELGALFDMRFEVSDELVGTAGRLADAARVEPELQERLTKRRAVGVGEAPPFVAPDASHRGGSEQGRAEPGSLLVPEGDDLQREAESRPPLLVGAHTQQAHDLQGHEHAEHAVEATSVRNGVEVRPEQERRFVAGRHAARVGSEPADLVAGGILAGGHADLAHPLRDETVHAGVLGRQIHALEAALHRGLAGQLVAARHHASSGCGDRVGGDVEESRRHRSTSAAASTPPPTGTRAPKRRSTCSSATSVVKTASGRAL